MRTLSIACLGLWLGALPAAGRVQDPPIFIPNDEWAGLLRIGDPGRIERETKSVFRGPGLRDFSNLTLGSEVRRALSAVVTSGNWQAPALLDDRPYRQGTPSFPVFLDVYYDTREGANFLSLPETTYRFRSRFPSVSDIPNLFPERLEYQSKFDGTVPVDGFTAVTEARFEHLTPHFIGGDRLDGFVQSPQTGMLGPNVLAPSEALVRFFERKTGRIPRLSYSPNLVVETDRSRVHWTVDLSTLEIGHAIEEAFIITTDTSRVYLAADYLRWLKREVGVKPSPSTTWSEVEVEFERAASGPLDEAIAQARSTGNTDRVDQLTQVLNAFLADLRAIVSVVRARFAEISRLRGDANYLVLEPGIESKYRTAFKGSGLFTRGDENFSGKLDVTDAVNILCFLACGTPVDSLKACDVNDDGTVDISDPIYLLQFLFLGGPPPPPPFPFWGVDPTP